MIPNSPIPNADFLWWLDILVTFLSTLGSIWMILSCIRRLSEPNLSIKLVLAIAISDLIFSICNILSNFERKGETNRLCFLEAMLRETSFLFAMLFTALAAMAPHLVKLSHSRFNRNIFLALALVAGLVISWLLTFFIVNIFERDIIIGNGPFVCWYTYRPTSQKGTALLIVMLLEGMPLIIGLIVSLIGYVSIFKSMRNMPKFLLAELNFNPYHLLWYPVVLFITFTPGLINRIYLIYNDDHSSTLEALYLGLKHLVGFSNALVYGFQRNLFQQPRKSTSAVSSNDYEIDRNDSRGFSFLEESPEQYQMM